MRLLYLLRLRRLVGRQDIDRLLRLRSGLRDPLEQLLSDIALAALHFTRGNNSAAQRLFVSGHAAMRERHDGLGRYLGIFCMVHISLLRRNLQAAAGHAGHAKHVRPPLLVRSIYPIPELAEKVLYQNTIEAVG
jgi:hypothetical protein